MTDNKTLILAGAGAAILYFATKASACSTDFKPIENWSACNTSGTQTKTTMNDCGDKAVETRSCNYYPPIPGYATPDGTTPIRTSVIHTVNNIPLLIVSFAGIHATYGPLYNLARRDSTNINETTYTSGYEYLKLANVETCSSYKLNQNIGTTITKAQFQQAAYDFFYSGKIDYYCYSEIADAYFSQP